MIFISVTRLCNHYHYLIPEHFYHPTNKPCTRSQSLSILPSLQALAAITNLLLVSIDLFILDISHTWNHTVCGLLCLASFTQHVVSKAQPCCSTYRHFIPFYSSIIFPHTGRPHFVCLFVNWCTSGCSCTLNCVVL